jgi:transposase-like protein
MPMKCPHCETNVELDSKLYFKSFFGRYTCPSCSSKFKLKRGYKYLIWIIIAIVIAFLDSFYVMEFAKETSFSAVIFASWLVVLFFAFCYIDRRIENNMPTVKI